LKRAFRFRKFFGYFLPKKVTTRKPHAQNSALRLRHGVGRDAPGKKNPRPAESAAVCGGKLQSKGLGFGADCKPVSRLHTLLTHRNLRHAGWQLKRAFRFRKVLWLLSSKESNYKKTPCSKQCARFASRRGP
jgi:hypothetical protein